MKKFYLLFISIICLNFGYSQSSILVAFDLKSDGSNPTAVQKVSGIPSAEGFTSGAGISNTNLNGTAYKTNNWNATSLASARSLNEYIQWSVTVASSLSTEITGLNLRLKSTTGGPSTAKIYYSYDAFATAGIELNAGNENLSVNAGTNLVYSGLSIVPAPGATITFRVYGWGASNPSSHLNIEGYGGFNMPGKPSDFTTGGNIIGEITPLGSFDGLVFNNGTWFPSAPSLSTKDKDVKIEAGTYLVSAFVQVKNVTVEPGAAINIKRTGSLQVNGHLITSNNITIESNSLGFGGLMVIEYVDEDGIKPSVPAQVTGTVKYLRYVNTVGSGQNDLISAPVTGQRFIEFRTSNPNLASSPDGKQFLFGPFDKATGLYVTYTDTSNDILEPGIGYKAASRSGNNLIFNGTVNVDRVDVPILESGPHAKEWNLIGNPYPSHISLLKFLATNGEDRFHVDGQGIYGYNPGNQAQKWEALGQPHVDNDPTLAIAPGQGFYVPARPVGGTVTFRPDMMFASRLGDFVSGRTENKTTDIGLIKLNITNEGKNYYTELFFTDKATKGLDPGYDLRVYGSKAEVFSLYSHLVEDNKGTDMAVQSVGYSDLATGVKIPIGINASEGMQITVNIADLNLPEGTEVRLEDNSNNTFTLLNTSDYTFTATSNLKDIGRFFLHVSTKPLSNKDDILNGLQIYTTNKSKTLYVKGLIKDQAQVNIYDIQGRIMTSASLKANTNSNEVDMSNLSTGIYVVELKSSGSVKTQKVILK